MGWETIILISTGIVAVIYYIFLIVVIQANKTPATSTDNNSTDMPDNTPNIPIINPNLCTQVEDVPDLHAPTFNRIIPVSNCLTPLDTTVTLSTTTNTVSKSYKARSLNIAPTNHWISPVLYNSRQALNFYPYNLIVEDDGVTLSWPNSEFTISGRTGLSDISTISQTVGTCKIRGRNIVTCDVVDYDALTATIIWQGYSNKGMVTQLLTPLAKGCPFITFETISIATNITFDTSFTVSTIDNLTYLINGSNFNYLVIFSTALNMKVINTEIFLPPFTGTMRIAYYANDNQLNVLLNNSSIYPIAATVSNITSNGITNVFNWSTKSINANVNQDLIMAALPHHNISNTVLIDNIDHPLLPYRIVSGSSWYMTYESLSPIIEYETIQDDDLSTVWYNESIQISKTVPREPVQWFKWLGSLAILTLIGESLQANISNLITLMKQEIVKYPLYYDTTWGGVINTLGATDCTSISNDGNSFYNNHIGQYGYLLMAYATISYFDTNFLIDNLSYIMYLVRDIANPCANDPNFPLWRHKDWYLGYSLISGLEKETGITYDQGSVIQGYYASYLIGILTNNIDLTTWANAMYSTEVTAMNYYYQFTSFTPPKIDVDDAYVQGTINQRSSTSYNYTRKGGDIKFPQRNASLMIPLLKPIFLQSNIPTQWALVTQSWMSDAISGSINSESLAYALALLAVDSEDKSTIIDLIVTNSTNMLPYGSTWTSILYWVLQT